MGLPASGDALMLPRLFSGSKLHWKILWYHCDWKAVPRDLCFKLTNGQRSTSTCTHCKHICWVQNNLLGTAYPCPKMCVCATAKLVGQFLKKCYKCYMVYDPILHIAKLIFLEKNAAAVNEYILLWKAKGWQNKMQLNPNTHEWRCLVPSATKPATGCVNSENHFKLVKFSDLVSVRYSHSSSTMLPLIHFLLYSKGFKWDCSLS